MISLSHKSKQYLLVALKVLIIGCVLVFLYDRIANTSTDTWDSFKNHLLFDLAETKWILIAVLLLTILNWLLEILKWKSLIGSIHPISIHKATQQTFAGSALSFITPAKIGDYGIKASYYSKPLRKKTLLLNLTGNVAQMVITSLFGIASCYYLAYHKDMSEIKSLFPWLLIMCVLILGLLYFFKNKQWISKRFSVKNVWQFFLRIKREIKVKVILYSLIRYLCFSSCFYLLLRIFGGNISFINAIAPIFAMYFLSSILPSFFILDIAVRGGIAALLLAPYGVGTLPVLSATLSMWLLNFALPALIGSYFVMTFKPHKTA